MTKREVFRKIKERHESIDLNSHIHELRAQEAALINNNRINAQLKCLEEAGGLDWLIEAFLEEE